MYDVWFSSSTEYFTGSILPKTIDTGMTLLSERYIIDITNLKNSYHSLETSRFNLYVRNKNWNPNVYTVVQATPEGLTIQSASYRVYRVSDGLNVVGYGTGSDLYTGLSHDVSGNYFNFDMKLLEPGYTYAFKFAFYDEQIKSWEEQVDSFKFRVEKSNQ